MKNKQKEWHTATKPLKKRALKDAGMRYMKAKTDWERGQSRKPSLSVQEELAGNTSDCQVKSAEENNQQSWVISWQERSLDHSNQKIKGKCPKNQPERREGWKNSWQVTRAISWQEQSADKSNRLTRAINWQKQSEDKGQLAERRKGRMTKKSAGKCINLTWAISGQEKTAENSGQLIRTIRQQ